MGQVYIQEFTGGLDSRRLPETTPGGVLITALNGHITRGGEFEKRASMVPTFTLPAGTIGMAQQLSGIVVFGSIANPGMPSGVTYQRLQHPDGVTALVDVLSYDLYSGKIYVVGEFADGSIFHYYDGARVTDWFDGRARASFQITSGVTTPSASNISQIKVNGVSIISTTVNWTVSNSKMAIDTAAAINAFVSVPDYSAIAVDDRVVIIAATAGAASNGFGVAVTYANGLAIDPAAGLALAGGVDLANVFEPGPFVRTIGSKMYSVSGPNLHFSGIGQPTQWTTDAVGAGFIDMSTYASGSEDLKAVAPYQNYIAIFSETNVQIWYVDPDPSLNKQSQILNNTGTTSPQSVTQFSDNDLFYLNESGLRSLRARDASNSAATTDIGVPVDTLITAKLQMMSEDEREDIIGLIEPQDGRFWLIMGQDIFVFSFFSGAKVSAWSLYDAGFVISSAVVFNRRVYVRSGNTIYVYGGIGDQIVYDDVEAVAQIPYLNANDPSREKNWQGVDIAARGDWKIYAATRPQNLAANDKIAEVTFSTFDSGEIGMMGSSTHISLIFKTQGSGYARLGSAVIHYESSSDDD